MTPRSFGKYLLDREIARGGMARVHLARLRGLGGFEKRLVLKEIDPALASDPRFVTLFVEEANTLVQMSHPNIVPVYELGVVEGTYFLAMEHVQGTTLEALVRDTPLEPEEAAHVGAQVADALAYAHERFGLVHRDVTPRNVMIDVHGHARLLDFGIAARIDSGESSSAIFGTPGFLSPEQARGERLTAQSDLFSLAAVLYRAVTSRHAIEPTVEASRSLTQELELPLLDRLPAELGRTISAALSPDPAARPASGKAMAAQLRAFLAARRPEGVADALGTRADRLATRLEIAAEDAIARRDAVTNVGGRTQSLATSPVLDAILGTPPAGTPERAAPKPDSVSPTAPIAPLGPESAGETPEEPEGPGTQRLDRVSAGSTPSTTAPASASTAGAATIERSALLRVGLITVALSALAVWALSMARFEAPTQLREPRPLDFTPLERDPPDAADDAPELASDAGTIDAADGIDAADWAHAAAAAPADAARRGPDARAPRVSTAVGGASGTITVQALPWADVVIDGEPAGRTPLRGRSLAAGRHDVLLRCPPLGREVRRSLLVEAGRAVRVSADLQTSPPTVDVRQ